MTLSLHPSPDGQWCAVRRGKQTAWYALGPTAGVEPLAEPTTRVELPEPASELLLIGPPTQAITVTRSGDTTSLQLLSMPKLERIAALSLAGRWMAATVTGSRAALLAEDARTCTVVRAAGKSLVAQVIDPGSGLIDHVLGMERQQLAVATTKKIEVWDAVSARPLTRLQLQLPPPPRTVGSAAGHWWILRAEQILLVRLSDGRPFLHNLGASIRAVVSHPASPWLVVATSRGLVRISCYAHAMVELEAPSAEAYAIAPAGDEAVLIGAGGFAQSPWVMRLSASAAATGVPRVTTGVVVTTGQIDALPVAVVGRKEPLPAKPAGSGEAGGAGATSLAGGDDGRGEAGSAAARMQAMRERAAEQDAAEHAREPAGEAPSLLSGSRTNEVDAVSAAKAAKADDESRAAGEAQVDAAAGDAPSSSGLDDSFDSPGERETPADRGTRGRRRSALEHETSEEDHAQHERGGGASSPSAGEAAHLGASGPAELAASPDDAPAPAEEARKSAVPSWALRRAAAPGASAPGPGGRPASARPGMWAPASAPPPGAPPPSEPNAEEPPPVRSASARPGAPSWFAGAAARAAQQRASTAATSAAAPSAATPSSSASPTPPPTSPGSAATPSATSPMSATPPASASTPAADPSAPSSPPVPAWASTAKSAAAPNPASRPSAGASDATANASPAASGGAAPAGAPSAGALASTTVSSSAGGPGAASSSEGVAQPSWFDASTPAAPLAASAAPARSASGAPSFGPAERIAFSGGPRPVPSWAATEPLPRSTLAPPPSAPPQAPSSGPALGASTPPSPSPATPAERASPIAPPAQAASTSRGPGAPAVGRTWRAELSSYGSRMIDGAAGVPPSVSSEELTILARRLNLSDEARLASTILYAAWLAGQPFVAMDQLAALLGDHGWQEALGAGQLGQLGLLRHRDGGVALRRSVADALDGRPWGAIRVTGEADAVPVRLPGRLGRTSVAAWPVWQAYLGKVALVTGKLRRALVEARLAELVAVTFQPLTAYPSPWPTGTNLLVVTDVIGGLTELLPELDTPPAD